MRGIQFMAAAACLWMAGATTTLAEEMHPSIKAALAHPDRPAADLQLDEGRQIGAVLDFFGVRPGMTVVEVYATRGRTAEVLARIVGGTGRVYMQNVPKIAQIEQIRNAIETRLAGNRLPNVVRIDRPLERLGIEPDSVDGAVINIVFHDFFNVADDVPAVLTELRRILLPGGFVGVVDHAARAGTRDHMAKGEGNVHRIDEEYAKELFRQAGFLLEAETQLLRQPDDPRQQSVFEMNGRPTDRFVLLFRKPR